MKCIPGLLVLTVLLPSIAAAQTGPPPAWQGPYLYGLDESAIDTMIDHYIEEEGWDPTWMPVGYRTFAKMQLTAPFECWKFEHLCAQYGETGADLFVGDFVDLMEEGLSLPVFLAAHESLLETYNTTFNGLNSPPEYLMTQAEADQYHDALIWAGMAGVDWPLALPDEESEGTAACEVAVTTGRAKYVVAGHSWATAKAKDSNGPFQTSITVGGQFQLNRMRSNGAPSNLIDVSKTKTKFASSVTVTAIERMFLQDAFAFPGFGRWREYHHFVFGAACGDTATLNRAFFAHPVPARFLNQTPPPPSAPTPVP